MFMFGGWNYESVLDMVDSLVYGRRYGGFYDIITNFTVRELMELFTVIQNKINSENIAEAMSAAGGEQGSMIPTQELSQEMLNFLMDV